MVAIQPRIKEGRKALFAEVSTALLCDPQHLGDWTQMNSTRNYVFHLLFSIEKKCWNKS